MRKPSGRVHTRWITGPDEDMENIDGVCASFEDEFERVGCLWFKASEVPDQLRVQPVALLDFVPGFQDLVPEAKRGARSCAPLFRHDGVVLLVSSITLR